MAMILQRYCIHYCKILPYGTHVEVVSIVEMVIRWERENTKNISMHQELPHKYFHLLQLEKGVSQSDSVLYVYII